MDAKDVLALYGGISPEDWGGFPFRPLMAIGAGAPLHPGGEAWYFRESTGSESIDIPSIKIGQTLKRTASPTRLKQQEHRSTHPVRHLPSAPA